MCDEDCSKSCGTAGRQTLPAARQKHVDSLEIGRGYEASPRG